jgi:hypothetical protein
VSAATQQDAATTIAKLVNDQLLVYRGAIVSNDGKIRIPQGKALQLNDPELDQMNWLTAGVIGSAS